MHYCRANYKRSFMENIKECHRKRRLGWSRNYSCHCASCHDGKSLPILPCICMWKMIIKSTRLYEILYFHNKTSIIAVAWIVTDEYTLLSHPQTRTDSSVNSKDCNIHMEHWKMKLKADKSWKLKWAVSTDVCMKRRTCIQPYTWFERCFLSSASCW